MQSISHPGVKRREDRNLRRGSPMEGAEEPKSTEKDRSKAEQKSKDEGQKDCWQAGAATMDWALETPKACEDPFPKETKSFHENLTPHTLET